MARFYKHITKGDHKATLVADMSGTGCVHLTNEETNLDVLRTDPASVRNVVSTWVRNTLATWDIQDEQERDRQLMQSTLLDLGFVAEGEVQ